MNKPMLYMLVAYTRLKEAHFVGDYTQCVQKAIELYEPDAIELSATYKDEVPPQDLYPTSGSEDEQFDWLQHRLLENDMDGFIDIFEADNNFISGPLGVLDVLSPFEIRETYERLFHSAIDRANLEVGKSEVQREIDLALAELSRPESGIEWAKNEDSRKLQRYELTRDLQVTKSEIETSIAKVAADMSADRILVEMYAALINYFRTGQVDIPEEVKPE